MKEFPDLKTLIGEIDARLGEIGDRGALAAQMGAKIPDPVVKYVLVDVGSRRVALPIENLAEVGALPKVTKLPNLPGWIRGVMNIRSEIVSLIDFSRFLGDSREESGKEKKLVVLRKDKMKVGMTVQRMVGTVTKTAKEVSSLPQDKQNPVASEIFHSSIQADGRLFSILDVGRFLEHPQLVDFGKETVL